MTAIEKIKIQDLTSACDRAVGSVFESYFFMEPSAFEGEVKHEAEVFVELSFRGPFNGRLFIQMSRETAYALTESMPLSAGKVDEDIIADVFAEIANAMGGRIAASLVGDEDAFDLTIPEVHFHDPLHLDRSLIKRSYETDLGPITLSVAELSEVHHSFKKGA